MKNTCIIFSEGPEGRLLQSAITYVSLPNSVRGMVVLSAYVCTELAHVYT